MKATQLKMRVYFWGRFLIVTCLFGKRQADLLDLILVLMLLFSGAQFYDEVTECLSHTFAIPDCDCLECAELAQNEGCYRGDEGGDPEAYRLL